MAEDKVRELPRRALAISTAPAAVLIFFSPRVTSRPRPCYPSNIVPNPLKSNTKAPPHLSELRLSSKQSIALTTNTRIPIARRNQQDDANMPDLGDGIDGTTFAQILELDDSEDDRDFSKGIVWGFFEQAEDTFRDMDDAL